MSPRSVLNSTGLIASTGSWGRVARSGSSIAVPSHQCPGLARGPRAGVVLTESQGAVSTDD